MKLITADELTYTAFADMIDDYAVAGTPFLGMTSPDSFPYFVRVCVKHAAGVGLNRSSCYTRYFLVDEEGTIYAQGDVRHEATRQNVTFAGQLGYGVLPSRRRQGYGTLICRLLLEKARQRGFESVIITCRDENTASAKIIEKNGGKLLEKKYSHQDHTLMRRYEVDLRPAETSAAWAK